MSDKLSVINRALFFLGEQTITNPDSPETTAGKKVAGVFDASRREVLRRYPWNFAEVWEEIDKTTAPAFGFTDAYALPQKYIRLLWVGDPNTPSLDYRLLTQAADFRRVIAINNGGASKLKIGYGADVELLSLWDPLALKVLAMWIACDAAKTITGKMEYAQVISEMLSEELKDAVGVDGQEQAVLRDQRSFVQDARNFTEFGGSVLPWTNVGGY